MKSLAWSFIVGTAAALGVGASPAFAAAGCVGDMDGNGVIDVDDLLTVIESWGNCTNCSADVDNSGAVDVDDLLTIIDVWGPCGCGPEEGCLEGTEIWCEDWELGNYSRWTGGYSSSGTCRSSGFVTNRFVTPTRSHRSRVTCAASSSHRGYGGLRFQGDNVVPSFHVASSGGIDAPHGVVVTFWVWLEVPYTFSPTRWLSLLTVTHDCSNNWDQVVTVNLDDSSMRLKPVHVSSVQYAPNAPSFPRGQWVRVTSYINYYTGEIHVWQDGTKVVRGTFSRPNVRMCQWHWGLYASGNNDNITLYEDDISIVKLQEPLVNFNVEPRFPNLVSACTPIPLAGDAEGADDSQ